MCSRRLYPPQGTVYKYVDADVIKPEQAKSVVITQNGTTEVTPDEGKTLNKVTITTNTTGVTKGLVFDDYDDSGYPHSATIRGMLHIPAGYCYRLFSEQDGYASVCSKYITSIVIPDGVITVGASSFYGCHRLTDITLSTTLTSLGKAAFYYCIGLTSITLPEGVTSIGEDAFNSCRSLSNIIIPKGVTSIGDYAFIGCSSLRSIIIPEGVMQIGPCVLQIGSSTNKATITFKGTIPPTISSRTFISDYLNKIYVPSGSVEAYKTATNWVAFADYIEADPNEETTA